MLQRLILCFIAYFAASACAPLEPAQSPAAPAEAPATAEQPPAEAGAERGPVLERIVQRGTLRVGTSGDQPPFTMKDQQGKLLGFEIDLANALGRALEVKVELVTLPFGELLPAVETGNIDLALSSITMTPQRNMDVAFVGPYFVSGKALLTKDETLSRIKTPADLDNEQMQLAALKGSTSAQIVSQAAPRANLTLFDTYDEAVQAVADGKVHALVADLPIVAVTLARFPDAGFVAVGDRLSFEPIGVAVPADDAHFQNLIGNYVNMLEGVGALEALRKRWFDQTDWMKALPPASFGRPLDPVAPPSF